ncbi:unnamed protein product, partial [Musa hybrid cultivar]
MGGEGNPIILDMVVLDVTFDRFWGLMRSWSTVAITREKGVGEQIYRRPDPRDGVLINVPYVPIRAPCMSSCVSPSPGWLAARLCEMVEFSCKNGPRQDHPTRSLRQASQWSDQLIFCPHSPICWLEVFIVLHVGRSYAGWHGRHAKQPKYTISQRVELLSEDVVKKLESDRGGSSEVRTIIHKVPMPVGTSEQDHMVLIKCL